MTEPSGARGRSYDSRGRKKNAEANRDAILEAARQLFASRGFEATTIDAIAEAASVSAPTVYAAFSSKRGILKAILNKARFNADYDAAVAAGIKQHNREAEDNRKTESDLRAQLAERDTTAQRKEREYAQNLADAQRRVRAGTDRLRCPTAGPVQPAAAPGDRPVAAEPAADGGGPDLVPEAAADVLGYGAAIAGLVRRYDQVVARFEACRAVNAKQ